MGVYAMSGIFLQCLFLSLVMAGGSLAQTQKMSEINLQLRAEGKVELVLSEIERLTDFKFSVNRSKVNLNQQVVIDSENSSLMQILKEISRQTNLKFKRINESIHVSEMKQRNEQMVEEIIQTLQNRTVRGKVTSAEDSEGLPGVNVVEKGTRNGTVTDIDGNYSLDVSEGATLVFSSVGFTTEEVAVGNRSVIDLNMTPDIQQLQELVVTAFGIEKDTRGLTYATQSVEGESVSMVNNPNVLNGLQGKVAGVTIRQNSGQPGTTPRINIRGNSSLTGGSEPIYVIDGQIIDGSIIDLNPKDVESVNVLKGPTAAALYGILASNGAIVITTKKGANLEMGAPVVTLETGYNVNQVTRLPNAQTTYAQGSGGRLNLTSSLSWGPRIDTLGTYINQFGLPEEAAVYDNDKDFFVNGGTYTVDVDVANNFEKGNYSIGGGYTKDNGIVERTGFERFNFNFAGDFNLTQKLKVGTTFNTIQTSRDGVPPGGNSNYFFGAFFAPPSYNLAGNPINVPGEPYRQLNFRTSHDNIYWSVLNNSEVSKTDRVFGNVRLNYQAFDWMAVNLRVGNDYSTFSRKEVLALGSGGTGGRTNPPSGGRITDRSRTDYTLNANLNVNLNKTFGDFNLNLLLGSDFLDRGSRDMITTGNNIIIGGFDNISNTSSPIEYEENVRQQRIVGYFANFEGNWRNTLYLNITGRNDVVSNLPRTDRSYFYPSVGLGYVFTETFDIPENIISFGKIRATYAEVGNAGPLFVQAPVFNQATPGAGNDAGPFIFPFNGVNAYSQSGQLLANLRPEYTQTIELGFDIRFVNDRLRLDYTYFNNETSDQIFNVPIPNSTGFTSQLSNAGAVSANGHEIILDATPIATDNFSWNVITNFTTYNNEVVSLAEGIDEISSNANGRVYSVRKPGEDFFAIRGSAFARDPESGKIVVNADESSSRYGMPLGADEEKILGSAIPDFEFGFINTFRYKGLSLTAQIDWRQGGVLYSGINRLGQIYGILDYTEDRTTEVVLDAKKGFYNEDNELVIVGDNDIPIVRGETYWRYVQDIDENVTYDASFVRLRELSLNYALPTELFENNFIRSATVYLVGRNLALKSNVPSADPEEIGDAPGVQYLTYPQIMSFGGGVKVQF